MGFTVDKKLEIFKVRPELSKHSFDSGIPLQATAERMESIILYTPDMQSIGAIDNTASDATTTYAKSVTTGFTFGVSTTISVETSLEATVEFVKVGLKVTSSITISSQWSTSVTETMQFFVPAGKMAFTYQGYIWSEIMVYRQGNYTWSTEAGRARCLTNILATSRVPLVPS
jgi:hypothetical protein